MRLVVSDTGPVLHLHEAQALHLLQAADEVVVPPAVDHELHPLIRSWPTVRPHWLATRELNDAARQEALRWRQGGLLDAGEAEALALARQLQADWVLTDDTAARVLATQIGVEAHGSLGIVLRAAAIGRLCEEEAHQTLERLFESSLWVSPRVRAEAMTALRHLFEA